MPLNGDVVTLYNGSWSQTRRYGIPTAGAWNVLAAFFGGDVLVDGTLTANKVAARAITASKLSISDTSMPLPDSDLTDNASWSGASVWETPPSGGAWRGSRTAQLNAAAGVYATLTSLVFPVEPGHEYHYSWQGQVLAGAGRVAAQLVLSASSNMSSPTYLGLGAGITSTSLTELVGIVTIPAGYKYARFQFFKNNDNATSVRVGGPIFRRAVAGELIVDGAITATKISVNNLSAISANLGTVNITTQGSLRSGQTGYNVGSGFWMGIDGGTPKFSIGNASGQRITWNGTNLDIVGGLAVGSSPALNGTTMTGSGFDVNADGTFAIGNTSRNLTFNGSTLTLNGDLVSTNNVQAGSITASKIAAGSITASKMYLVSDNMNKDPDFEEAVNGLGWPATIGTIWRGWVTNYDWTGWTTANNNWNVVTNPATNSTEYNLGWYRYLSITGVAANLRQGFYWMHESADNRLGVPCEGNEWYEATIQVVNTSNNSLVLYVESFDAAGNWYEPAGARVKAGTSNGSVGAGQTGEISLRFQTHPQTARIRFVGWSEPPNATTAMTGRISISKLLIRRMSDANLIVDGAITTNKMTANSINGDRIQAETLEVDKLKAGTLRAGQSITVGTPTNANGGIVITSGATPGTDRIDIRVSNINRVRLGNLGTNLFGLQLRDSSNNLLLDSTELMALRSNSGNDSYNLGDVTTNPQFASSANGTSNIAIGEFNLSNQVTTVNTRSYNVAIGKSALRYLTSGGYNLAIGHQAGRGISASQVNSGNYNVFLGFNSGIHNLSGSYNIGVGYRAVRGNQSTGVTGFYNIGIGYDSLAVLQSGGSNVAVGNYAASSLTTGSNNVAIGTYALSESTETGKNVAIGASAGTKLGGTSLSNVIIGKDALSSTSGQDNLTYSGGSVYIGAEAAMSARASSTNPLIGNVIIGFQAGQNLNASAAYGNASYNTLIGHNSGQSITTGKSNTILGYNSGTTITTGNKNIIIGENAGSSASVGLSNVIILGDSGSGLANGDIAFGTNGARRAHFSTSLNRWVLSGDLATSIVYPTSLAFTTIGTSEIKAGTGDGASYTVYNLTIRSWWGIGFRDYTDGTTVKAYLDCRSGTFSTKGQLISTVATGTAPLQVSSTTQVNNLNASLLEGLPSSYFLRRINDTWAQSAEGAPRFWFATNNRTYFASSNGYEWRKAGTGDYSISLAVLEDSGRFILSSATSGFTTRVGTTNQLPNLQVHATSQSNGSVLIGNFNASSTGGPAQYFTKSRADIGSHGLVQAGDTLGILSFGGSDGTKIIEGVRILTQAVGTPAANVLGARLIIYTNSTSSNSTVSEAFRLDETGGFFLPRIGTTASAANAFINSASTPANQLLRSTSSRRYKRDIRDIPKQISEKVLELRPVLYKSKAEADDQNKDWYGLIAEEVAEIDPGLVHWTELDGELVPDGVQYDRLSVLLLSEIKELKQKLALLIKQ